MVPVDLYQELSGDDIKEEEFDFLAPLEILNGNCLALYSILDPDNILRKLEFKKQSKKKSLI